MDLKLLLYEIRSIFLRSKVLKYLRNDSDRFSREISYLQNSCKLSWISNVIFMSTINLNQKFSKTENADYSMSLIREGAFIFLKDSA